jgi:NAD(P)H-hydrate epimerase
MATLRSGAGLVKLAVPASILDVVAGFNPCYMTTPLPANDAGIAAAAREPLATLIAAADVVAIGPGIGRSDELTSLVCELWKTIPVPAVFDADALNALASQNGALPAAAAPRIITPHPGEFSRLTGVPASQTAAQRTAAIDWAARHHAVVVLKGHHSLITDGQQAVENSTGNPGMATGGSGDVLTGIIAALMGQKLTPFAAAQLGVYLHGLAGDYAAETLGEICLTANDLVGHLPAAFADYFGTTR